MKKAAKVFVAMSGGVDSSVAAALLKKKGYGVTGVFMRCYNLDGCEERDARDARRVAAKLKIPFYAWDFEKEYKKAVVKYMVDGYRRGITPNPDVMCNKKIKFGLFLKKALRSGAEYVATGHYARLREKDGKFSISTARDRNKDQSYFLWTLGQKELRHSLFPVGGYVKSTVRKFAKEFGLHTAGKKDSQGICFLGKVSIYDFLRERLPEKRGLILDASGNKLGEHLGAHFYTIGQRHGLGISGSHPYYVAGKNIKRNEIVVVEGDANPALYKKELILSSVNWTHGNAPRLPVTVLARVRYRQPLSKAKITKNGKSYKLIFARPQRFVAPGQSAVFYMEQGEMLGGGVIL
ncbi:MAG: tRNA 2-thiouridine(34) synthase MnmA [Patescibacteria group bacterium]